LPSAAHDHRSLWRRWFSGGACPPELQRTVATALAIAAQTGQLFWDADLHRLDGDLLLATDGPADEAATRYHRALAIAREQGARSFELRAATSLARLWRDQGKRGHARDLLATVYKMVVAASYYRSCPHA
jgi:predicted ATPase